MKTKILKAASLCLALVTCLTVFGLNFSRMSNKAGKDALNLSVLKAKAQSGEDCDRGANGVWVQTGGSTYTHNGRICAITDYTFFCYSSSPFVCDASCYAGDRTDICF